MVNWSGYITYFGVLYCCQHSVCFFLGGPFGLRAMRRVVRGGPSGLRVMCGVPIITISKHEILETWHSINGMLDAGAQVHS